MNKIFQIGFNKCGTWSIYNLFMLHVDPKVKCVHWDSGRLAKSIRDNILLGKEPLSENYASFTVFGDMECCIKTPAGPNWFFAFKHFEEFDRHYPGSKFILNTRNVDAWVKSRMNHVCGMMINEDGHVENVQAKFYWEDILAWMNISDKSITKDDLPDIWKSEREEHYKRVFEYFKDRPQDLLVFDLDSDKIDKFKDFFGEFKFLLDEMPLTNRTIDRK